MWQSPRKGSRLLRYSRLKERVGEGVAVTKERKQAAELQKIEV